MRAYTHLTCEQRYQIYILCQAGHTQSEIAYVLNRDKSMMSRALHRNRGLCGYSPAQAHRFTWPDAAEHSDGAVSWRCGPSSSHCCALPGVRSRSESDLNANEGCRSVMSGALVTLKLATSEGAAEIRC
jgi:hypothetical protein